VLIFSCPKVIPIRSTFLHFLHGNSIVYFFFSSLLLNTLRTKTPAELAHLLLPFQAVAAAALLLRIQPLSTPRYSVPLWPAIVARRLSSGRHGSRGAMATHSTYTGALLAGKVATFSLGVLCMLALSMPLGWPRRLHFLKDSGTGMQARALLGNAEGLPGPSLPACARS
jgi:hypothetical protein